MWTRPRVGGRVPVPEASVVFTVKLPAGLAGRVRAHARERETTISAVVTRALTEFLPRGRREPSAQVSDRAVEAEFVFGRHAATDLSVAYAISGAAAAGPHRAGWPGRTAAP